MFSFRPAPARHRNLTALLCCLAACAVGALPGPAQVAYETRFEGVDDASLAALLHEVSETLSLQVDAPASVLHLRRRADRDVEHFTRVFQSRGYYGGSVSHDIQRDSSPVAVVFKADPGPQYTLGDVVIRAAGDTPLPDDALPAPDTLGLRTGAPALADPIANANATLLAHLRARGYPRPRIAKRDVVVDHATQSVSVTYLIEPGPAARYGAPDYQGLARTRPVVVDKLLPWQAGDPYDQRQLTELRTRLYDTGLFATASVEPVVGEMGEDGTTPVRITVTERPHRTMTAGLEYKSDEGVGAQFGWENRNVKGLGHRFRLQSTLATELRALDLRYRIDRFRRLDQALDMSFIIGQEEREAYDSDRLEGLALVERTVTPRLTLAAGAGLRIGRVEQLGRKNSHELLYLPLEMRLDRSDDLLDPTRGFRFRARIAPYVDPVGELRYFTKTDADFSHYVGWGHFETDEGRRLPNWVLATRVHLGAIIGESRDGVPADVRFYGGGGGSIRGYRFQTVSPLIGDNPIGGRSLAEFSIEVRRRVTETLGVVAFIDAGAAFESAYPDFSGDIQFGAGMGVRYYTPLGPLRFDVAVPLNKRDEIDDAFQIYLSIGHAF